jgi:hypothetical protein
VRLRLTGGGPRQRETGQEQERHRKGSAGNQRFHRVDRITPADSLEAQRRNL